jgi:hypothetical protein
VQHDRGQFHYRRVVFSSQLKSECGNILDKTTVLRITLNIDDTSSPPHNPVYERRVDPSTLSFSRSSHRHLYISLLFSFRLIVSL